MAVYINSAEILNSSNRLRFLNNSIQSDFQSMNIEVSRLFYNWDSVTSNYARNAFSKIINSYDTERYQKIERFPKFLCHAVNEVYVPTEINIHKYAKQFK